MFVSLCFMYFEVLLLGAQHLRWLCLRDENSSLLPAVFLVKKNLLFSDLYTAILAFLWLFRNFLEKCLHFIFAIYQFIFLFVLFYSACELSHFLHLMYFFTIFPGSGFIFGVSSLIPINMFILIKSMMFGSCLLAFLLRLEPVIQYIGFVWKCLYSLKCCFGVSFLHDAIADSNKQRMWRRAAYIVS